MRHFMRVFMVVNAIFLGGASTWAAEAAPKDYQWIINSLKADGISPSRIQWAQLEDMCKPIRHTMDDYNQCRLAKARLQYDFTEDQRTCEDTARAFQPPMLRYQAVATGRHPHDTGMTVVTLLNSVPAVANDEAFYNHLYSQCMQRQGWRNPRDYRRGYHLAYQ